MQKISFKMLAFVTKLYFQRGKGCCEGFIIGEGSLLSAKFTKTFKTLIKDALICKKNYDDTLDNN